MYSEITLYITYHSFYYYSRWRIDSTTNCCESTDMWYIPIYIYIYIYRNDVL